MKPEELPHTPEITPYRDGRVAAISLQFDDSMNSQIQNAIPLLAKYKAFATFFICPGTGHYKPNAKVWESDVLRAGHEIGNHTLNHKGANSVSEAESEIKGCSEILTRIYGNRPRLLPFATPGGVPWKLTADELEQILVKYRLFATPRREFFDDANGNPDPCAIPKKALANRSWIQFGMHGTGGEWLSTSVANLTRILDFLTANQTDIWTAPTGTIHQYVTQRSAAEPLQLTQTSSSAFTLALKCDPKKLPTYGLPFTTLYTAPLTIRVRVPASWKRFQIVQGKTKPATPTPTQQISGETIAQFDVLPNRGAVRITKG
ncbi:MAG: polysaccharide deacetylase family protein [Armatimonas sp.]